MKCYKHKDREAVAILDGTHPACRDCTTEYEASKLNAGEGVIILYQGEPKVLLIPRKEKISEN